VENVYNILQQIYSGNDVPNSITIAREFYRRYYKNILASFFLGTVGNGLRRHFPLLPSLRAGLVTCLPERIGEEVFW